MSVPLVLNHSLDCSMLKMQNMKYAATAHALRETVLHPALHAFCSTLPFFFIKADVMRFFSPVQRPNMATPLSCLSVQITLTREASTRTRRCLLVGTGEYTEQITDNRFRLLVFDKWV